MTRKLLYELLKMRSNISTFLLVSMQSHEGFFDSTPTLVLTTPFKVLFHGFSLFDLSLTCPQRRSYSLTGLSINSLQSNKKHEHAVNYLFHLNWGISDRLHCAALHHFSALWSQNISSSEIKVLLCIFIKVCGDQLVWIRSRCWAQCLVNHVNTLACFSLALRGF